MYNLGHPETFYSWGPLLASLTGFAKGPTVKPQMQVSGSARLHRRKRREFVSNPIGYSEYQGQLIPYSNLSSEHRGKPQDPEYHILAHLRDYTYDGGLVVEPAAVENGPDDSYLVGSGRQFRQANASIMSTVFHLPHMISEAVDFGPLPAGPERKSRTRRP